MRLFAAGTLLTAIFVAGSGCEEAPQEPATPPPESGPAAPIGAEPGGYPPPGEGAQLMPYPGGTPSEGASTEAADRDLPSTAPTAEGRAATAFKSAPLAGQSASLGSVGEEPTNELINDDNEFVPPSLETDSPPLEFDSPVAVGETSDESGRVRGRYGQSPVKSTADDGAN